MARATHLVPTRGTSAGCDSKDSLPFVSRAGASGDGLCVFRTSYFPGKIRLGGRLSSSNQGLHEIPRCPKSLPVPYNQGSFWTSRLRTALENTSRSLGWDQLTSGAVPQSKIKETCSAVSPPHSSHLNLLLHQGSALASKANW